MNLRFSYESYFIPITVNADGSEGVITPTWTVVEARMVKTSREVWKVVREQGWGVEVRLCATLITSMLTRRLCNSTTVYLLPQIDQLKIITSTRTSP